MKTKTVFISGQVSGISYIAAYNHFRNAEYALLHYEKEEVNTINPTHLCKSSWPWWLCMVVCLYNLVFKADAIYMLDNWHLSRGARIENKVARATGKEIWYE